MLRAYIYSQSLGYLVTGILIASLSKFIQNTFISCIGDIFIVLGIILGASSFSVNLMSKVFKVDSVFANLLFQLTLIFSLSSLIFMLSSNNITVNLVLRLSCICLAYALIILFSSVIVLVNNISSKPGYLKSILTEFKNTNRRQIEEKALVLFLVCFLAGNLSLILDDGALVYFGVMTSISIIALVASAK